MTNRTINVLRRTGWLSLLIVIGSMTGCGGGSTIKLVATSGTVMLDGKPLANATVAFLPADGPTATGTTGQDGKFRLTTGGRDGVVQQPCKVTITAISTGSGEAAAKLAAMKPEDMEKTSVSDLQKLQAEAGKKVLADKYARPDTSGLTADVSANAADNDFLFDLKRE